MLKRTFVIGFLALTYFFVYANIDPNSVMNLLTNGNEKIWNITHSLVNGYEMSYKSGSCVAGSRVKFKASGYQSFTDTSCNKSGKFADVATFTLSPLKDSMVFYGRRCRIDLLTSTRMILSFQKSAEVKDNKGTVIKTMPVTMQLLFEKE